MSFEATPPKPEARPRGRRPKTQPSGKKALVDAAVETFATRAYDRSDLRRIAADASVDPGLVRVHFGAKEGLWQACVDALTEEAAPIVAAMAALVSQQEVPDPERLARMITHAAAYSGEHSNLRKFVALQAAEHPDRAKLLVERLVRPLYDTLRPLIETGIAGGYIRVQHPAIFFAILHNAMERSRASPLFLNALAPDVPLADGNRLFVEGLITTLVDRCLLDWEPTGRSATDSEMGDV